MKNKSVDAQSVAVLFCKSCWLKSAVCVFVLESHFFSHACVFLKIVIILYCLRECVVCNITYYILP